MIFPDILTQRFRNLWQSKKSLAISSMGYANIEACVIGIIAALSAVLLKQGSGWLGTWRVHSIKILPPWVSLP